MKRKGKAPPEPLALGPEDLDNHQLGDRDYQRLRELIARHLSAHLPILVDEAVANAVDPIAASLSENLREEVVRRLVEEKETLIDDIIDEFQNPQD